MCKLGVTFQERLKIEFKLLLLIRFGKHANARNHLHIYRDWKIQGMD